MALSSLRALLGAGRGAGARVDRSRHIAGLERRYCAGGSGDDEEGEGRGGDEMDEILRELDDEETMDDEPSALSSLPMTESSFQVPGTKKWIELPTRAILPTDVRRLLQRNGVTPLHDEPMRVKLNEVLEPTAWFVPVPSSRAEEALTSLSGTTLGLMSVQPRALSEGQAQKMVASTRAVLPDGSEYVSLVNAPEETTFLDVKDFFRGYNIRLGGLSSVETGANAKGKQFLIKFTSGTEAFNAVQFKGHKPILGKRAKVGLMFS